MHRVPLRALTVAALALALAPACEKREAAPPASWEPRRTCAGADECRPAPACCPSPCTSDVIHRDDVAAVQRRVDATCSKAARANCPVAGACVSHVYACVRGRCALVLEGSADWPAPNASVAPSASAAEPVDVAPPVDAGPASARDDGCDRDDDCVPLHGGGGGCCPAPCPAAAVSRRGHARAAADLAAACEKVPRRPCPSAGGCRGHAILCVSHRCAVVYEGDPGFRPRK